MGLLCAALILNKTPPHRIGLWRAVAVLALAAGVTWAGNPPGEVLPAGVTVTNGTDMLITWPAVTTDVHGRPLAVTRYRLYGASDPFFVPDTVSFSNRIIETTGTACRLTNAMLATASCFYYVSAVAASGEESALFTRLIMHLAQSVPCAPGSRTFALLALPCRMPWTNAVGLSAQLAPAVRITRLNPATQAFETWDRLAATGVNFRVQGGDAVGAEVTNTCVLHLAGLHDTTPWLSWTAATNANRQHWLGLPPHGVYSTAATLAAAVTGATRVARWDVSNAVYESWFALAGAWRGDNFATAPGAGLLLSITSNVSWQPALPYPQASVTMARPAEFVESSVGLQATARVRDAESDIVEYRWDYEGDGVLDATGATPVLTYATTLTNTAVWYPSLWVRDRRGYIGLGYSRYETLSLSVSVSNQVFVPALGQTGALSYASSTNGAFTSWVCDAQGDVIRVLESNVWHSAGQARLAWDGRDQSGAAVTGVYYVVVVQQVGTNLVTYNPAFIHGGANAAGQLSAVSAPTNLSLRTGGAFPIQYTLAAPCWVTVRIMDAANGTLAVVCTNAPRLRGSHTEYWDGRLSNGALIGAGQAFSASVSALAMGANALIVKVPLPDIDGLTASPKQFMPAPNPYGKAPGSVTMSYSLAAGADVRMEVRAADGRVVRSVLAAGRSPGANQALWAGTDDQGRMVAEGYYSVSLCAEAGATRGRPASVWIGVYY